MTTSLADNSTFTLPAGMFRAYDIRGIAHTDLTTTNIRFIGQAIGYLALQDGQPEILFGADGRLSSPCLSAALKDGILDSGCHVTDLGIIPTPLLYFATHTSGCRSGVMLTASHNPADYNGIKIVRNGCCLDPEQIQQLRAQTEFLAAHPHKVRSSALARGSLRQLDMLPTYIDRICRDVHLQRRLRVVVDCGNAVAAVVAPKLYQALGCEVIPLFCELDGRFPNHHPDPTIAGNLASLISEVNTHKADLGVALDGDGDRVVIVTNQGSVIDTDRLLMLLVQDILPRYQNTGQPPQVVFDVKSSNLLARVIENAGGTAVMSRSGHSFMKVKMVETGAVIGAEFSAHVFIKDRWFGYDDGPYVAARFMEILAASGQHAEQMLRSLPVSVVTPELRITVEDSRKFELMQQIISIAAFPKAHINRLDGLRADFPDGWGLIRASNTTPALLLRFEASSRQALQSIQQAFRDLLQQVDPQLDFSD
jgi:phosphomannomutase/phosphoglucomutase